MIPFGELLANKCNHNFLCLHLRRRLGRRDDFTETRKHAAVLLLLLLFTTVICFI